MSPRDRRYLFGQCCVGSAIINVIINGALGWATFRGLGVAALPLWRIPGVAADLSGTAFGVTFGTCVGMAFQVQRDLKLGKIGHVAVSPAVAGLLARFPEGTLKRSVGLGVLSVPIFALPVVAALVALDIGAIERMHYIALKAGLAALEAALVTPLIVLAVLGDVRRRA